MATGMEMMISSAIKAAGLDPVKLKSDLEGFQNAIAKFIADDKAWKENQDFLTKAILDRLNSIDQKLGYSRDPLSVEPDSDDSKFAHFTGQPLPAEPYVKENFQCQSVLDGVRCDLEKHHSGDHQFSTS